MLLFNFDSVTKRRKEEKKKDFSSTKSKWINCEAARAKKKKAQLHWVYVRCLSTKPKREMNDALDSVYCKWIVEWSKAKTCISNFRNTFEAQEIFARGGHCHRPSAHVRILCCTNLSFSETHIQTHDSYAAIQCILCTCANARFNSFFFCIRSVCSFHPLDCMSA